MFTVDCSPSTLKHTFLSEALLMAVCMSDGDRSPLCIYGSVSAGREKWPFNVLFF